MARFIGTKEEFNKYISGFCRNRVQSMTKSAKNKQKGVCQYCKRHFDELESAHVNTSDRKQIINNILDKYTVNGIVEIDLNIFEQEFKDFHKPFEKHIYFLCKECHTLYDNNELTDEEIKERLLK